MARAVAYKVTINDILSGKYYPSLGEKQPNYVDVKGLKVTRANIIARVADVYENPEKKYAAVTLEEGEARIRAKFYETQGLRLQQGDLVKVIGKVKEDGQERFILGEIIKKVKPEHAELRKLMFEKTKKENNSIVEDVGGIA